jgi:hypothetical protein
MPRVHFYQLPCRFFSHPEGQAGGINGGISTKNRLSVPDKTAA